MLAVSDATIGIRTRRSLRNADGSVYLRQHPLPRPLMNLEEIVIKPGKKAGTFEKTEFHKCLLEQACSEYRAARDFIAPKRIEWELREALYMNAMRDKLSVGYPLYYMIVQTLMAAFYDDKLNTVPEGQNEADEERAEAFGNLMKYDAYVMEKEILDYFWTMDALKFGKGLVLGMGWDKKYNVPDFQLIDPMVFYHDPHGMFMQARFGKKAVDYFGYEQIVSLSSLKEMNGVRVPEDDDEEKQKGNGNSRYMNLEHLGFFMDKNDMETVSNARNAARGYMTQNISGRVVGDNAAGVMGRWFTKKDGDLLMLEIAGDMYKGEKQTCISRIEKLKFDYWPVAERSFSPLMEDFFGPSVGDIVEDKQRGIAKFINLEMAKAEYAALGSYVYDKTRVSGDDLAEPTGNKLIGIEGDITGAVAPMQYAQVQAQSQYIMNYLDQAAQQATATPAIQQGMTPDTTRSATELATLKQNVDRRYGLTAKIFGWSEKFFWEHYEQMYRIFFKNDADEKIIRINGPQGPRFEKMTATKFLMRENTFFRVESAVMSEVQRTTELQAWTNYVQVVAQDPNVNRPFMIKKLGRLNNLTTEEINMLYPKQPEELHAERENNEIMAGKMPKISIRDAHQIHIMEHQKTPPGPIRDAHIKAHQEAMLMIQNNSEIMPAPAAVNPANPQEVQGQAQAGAAGQPTAMNFKMPTYFG